MNDLIIQELHRIRQEYASSFNHDMKAICEDLRSKQGRDGHEVVSFPPKRPKGWIEPTTEQSAS